MIQTEFNDLTQYEQVRAAEKPSFLVECIRKFISESDYFSSRPDLNLEFYLGALLYSSEMKKHIDFFFDANQSDKLKRRKELRIKVDRVHDTLYKYSHEKLNKFVEIKELAFIYQYFFQKSNNDPLEDNIKESMNEIS